MLPVSVCLSLLLSLDVTGVVTDQSGRPVPRVLVQVVAADGTPAGSTFTDADGAFRIANAPDGCRVHASLTGFVPATTECSGGSLALKLSVAPIADHVVISATRTDAPSAQVGASVTVFDSAEIDRRQAVLVSDLLRDAPGAMVLRTGAPGGLTSLFVRGGESNYTKVLVDGVPLNAPGGSFDWSNITTENVDRVEFVRGANSALFGSDAMTGVVQLFTKHGEASKPQFAVHFEGGTFSTARGGGSLAGKSGRVDYSADAGGLATDNEVPNNRFREATFSGTVGAALGHGATLRFVGRLENGRAGTPGQTAFGRPDLDAFYARSNGNAGVSFDQSIGAFHQRAAYGVNVDHARSADLIADPPYTPAFDGHVSPFPFSDFTFDSQTNLTRHHLSYQADETLATVRAGTHVETALVEWDGERATEIDGLANTSVPASRDNVGLTLQHQALWARAFVTAGVRFEHNASFGNAFVPRVGASWYLHGGTGAVGPTRVHGTAGLGIKEPTITQSFSTSPFFLGNPNLQPERSRSIDAGIEQRLANDRLRLDVTWFTNRYRDLIGLQTIDPETFSSQYFNIGLTRARGAELSGDVALVSGFRFKAGYTYLDSKILESVSTSPVFAAGNAAFRRPRHSGFADLAWIESRVSVDLTGTFVGGRVDSDFSSLEPPLTSNERYTLWDLRASAGMTRRLSLTGAVDNLTDRQYMEPLGYPALGRAVRGGIRVRF